LLSTDRRERPGLEWKRAISARMGVTHGVDIDGDNLHSSAKTADTSVLTPVVSYTWRLAVKLLVSQDTGGFQ